MRLTLGIFRPEEKEIELTSSRLTPLPGGGNRRCGIGDAGWASGREGGRGGGRGGGFFQFGGRLGGAKIPFLARIAGWAPGPGGSARSGRSSCGGGRRDPSASPPPRPFGVGVPLGARRPPFGVPSGYFGLPSGSLRPPVGGRGGLAGSKGAGGPPGEGTPPRRSLRDSLSTPPPRPRPGSWQAEPALPAGEGRGHPSAGGVASCDPRSPTTGSSTAALPQFPSHHCHQLPAAACRAGAHLISAARGIPGACCDQTLR